MLLPRLPLLILGYRHLSVGVPRRSLKLLSFRVWPLSGPAQLSLVGMLESSEVRLRSPHPWHRVAAGNPSGQVFCQGLSYFWVLCVLLEYRGHWGKLKSSLSLRLTTQLHLLTFSNQPKRLPLEP